MFGVGRASLVRVLPAVIPCLSSRASSSHPSLVRRGVAGFFGGLSSRATRSHPLPPYSHSSILSEDKIAVESAYFKV
ncbi:hypothetical protein AAZX31_14G202700 [Glycine max]